MKNAIVAAVVAAAVLGAAGRNVSVGEYPRLKGETDDQPRLERSVQAAEGGVVAVPEGEYLLARPLVVTNFASFKLHKNATLKAVAEMDFVVKIDNSPVYRGYERHDFGTFFKGGRIDGDGLAGCMALDGFFHFTMRDVTFFNGRRYGLRVHGEKGGAELMANNLYFICQKNGLAGNTGLAVMGSDSHYTDVIVVDYTVGIDVVRGGPNFFTRCHVWGGPVKPAREGELPEMLKGSVGFHFGRGANANVLRDSAPTRASRATSTRARRTGSRTAATSGTRRSGGTRRRLSIATRRGRCSSRAGGS